ncbi:hypothetical protein M3J09_002834 [Ascochyta lentis]
MSAHTRKSGQHSKAESYKSYRCPGLLLKMTCERPHRNSVEKGESERILGSHKTSAPKFRALSLYSLRSSSTGPLK